MASPALSHAIHQAHLERLQSVLLTLCNASPIAQRVLERELLVDEEATESEEKNSNSRRALDVTALTERKRQRSRYATCKTCNQEFDVTKNDDGSCKSHDGALEAIEDEWPDHDEDCHGPVETQENLEEYPEKFRWECCEGAANAEGCVTGRHEEDTTFKPVLKKRKIFPSFG
ncbi:hypothetical protein BFW01_g4188 [Lasiodiplodia theobromae]|uniref:C2H2-type domain-containing protein n=1 Tax=Lasiodiplodia theobromae TaxID=45133 RepID=A0A5N5D9Q3_9PEZI|nr:hypothetical protein DBV05_g6864 [Lasiodiplodia theobromae]KAF9633294.1 hypothetical protein BFW01_g4188 [Lasiodiplodia theobromae]